MRSAEWELTDWVSVWTPQHWNTWVHRVDNSVGTDDDLSTPNQNGIELTIEPTAIVVRVFQGGVLMDVTTLPYPPAHRAGTLWATAMVAHMERLKGKAESVLREWTYARLTVQRETSIRTMGEFDVPVFLGQDLDTVVADWTTDDDDDGHLYETYSVIEIWERTK